MIPTQGKLRLREVKPRASGEVTWAISGGRGRQAVPTLLVAVQVDDLLQADGHGIVPKDAGR